MNAHLYEFQKLTTYNTTRRSIVRQTHVRLVTEHGIQVPVYGVGHRARHGAAREVRRREDTVGSYFVDNVNDMFIERTMWSIDISGRLQVVHSFPYV